MLYKTICLGFWLTLSTQKDPLILAHRSCFRFGDLGILDVAHIYMHIEVFYGYCEILF